MEYCQVFGLFCCTNIKLVLRHLTFFIAVSPTLMLTLGELYKQTFSPSLMDLLFLLEQWMSH